MSRLTERSPKTLRLVVDYVRYAADRMGLRDWQFELSDEPAKDDKIASTEVWGDSVTATLYLGPAFWTHGPRMQRETIVHELVHWHTDKVFRQHRDVASRLGPEAFNVAMDAFDRVHELAVDGIASAWARTLPLIGAREVEDYCSGWRDLDDPRGLG